MSSRSRVSFRSYDAADKDAVLAIFDANCPEFFAPNERDDYTKFLDSGPIGYEVCTVDDRVAAAFGLFGDGPGRRSLNWIMISPECQGMGIGKSIMGRVISQAREAGGTLMTIAASHKSAPFFERFDAVPVTVTPDGWGPGMTRIDMELRL